MLGLTAKSQMDRKLNAIIIQTKFYIYRQRLFYTNGLDAFEWFYEFKMYLMKERQICKAELRPKKIQDLGNCSPKCVVTSFGCRLPNCIVLA